jgi:hypothetical protein
MDRTPTAPAALGDGVRHRLFGRALESLRARRELREARRQADAEILRSAVPSLRVAWRAVELVEPERRRELARSIRRVVREADPRYLPGATPINRGGVRIVTDRLLESAERIEDVECPVGARGVLLFELLLLDGASPLYGPGPADGLFARIEEANLALEVV